MRMSQVACRPSVPQVAWLAAGMWAGCVAAERASWATWSAESPVRALAPVACALLVALGVGWRGGRTLRGGAALVACGLIAGVCVSGLQSVAWHRQGALVADAGARQWTGVVEADPTPGSYGTTVRVRLQGGPLDRARVRVRWPADAPVPEAGRIVRFSAILKPVPADEGWGRRTARGGACGTGSAWRAEQGPWRPGLLGSLLRWRCAVGERMDEVSGVGGALLEGIVLGDRRRLGETPTAEEFRVLGLSHLVAVSGTHLALACGSVALLGRLAGLSRRALLVATVAAGCGYAIVTGLPYSALRSLLMLCVGGSAVVFGRRPDGIASLAAAVAAVLTIEPWSVFDLGFQLSVLAVGGLLLFGGLATEWAALGMSGAARWIGQTVALTCVAQAFTVPVVAGTFGMFSVVAPLANVYAAPLVSVGLCLGLAAAVSGEVVPVAGSILMKVAAAVLGSAAWVSHHLATLPGAAIALGPSPALVALPVGGVVCAWVLWPRPRHRAQARRASAALAAVALVLIVGPSPARDPGAVVLDVGQGDAILVRDGGRAMLVDVGPDPTILRMALARTGVRRLDVVVLTHAHADHTGGAEGLSGVTSVGWVGVPCVGPPCVSEDDIWLGPDTPVRALAAGDSWEVGDMAVTVLWPAAKPARELSTNDTSVVLHVSAGDLDLVLTGDAESEAQRGMIERGALSPVEVLKVPHHGSSNGLTAEALAKWDPDVALVSVGEGNRFGHPSPSTMDLLGDHGIRVMRTDQSGDLAIELGGAGYRVVGSRRGGVAAVRARIGSAHVKGLPAVGDARHSIGSGFCGGQEYRRPETGLSHLRRRGVAARTRAPPSAAARR